MPYGLSHSELELILAILKQYPQVESAILYGSRAKSTFTVSIDVDIALSGNEIDRFTASQILLDIDDSNFPYNIDMQNISEIKNTQLLSHIQRVGIIIYTK